MSIFATLLLSIAAASADQPTAAASPAVTITAQIKSGKPITYASDEIAKLDRAKVQTGKGEQQRIYEGVPLANILQSAGVAWGTKCSSWWDCYVVVEGADKYRAVFSIPEIDPGLAHKSVLIADRCDGKPLSKAAGPYQVVEEDAKQRGRWVRQVTKITVRVSSE